MSANAITTPKFRLGWLAATPHVLDVLQNEDIVAGLARHRAGDWGDVCQEDRTANDQALENGTRLLSAYRSAAGLTFWIITEGDRSATTVLMPEDY
jgi:hypothetical protein